MTQACLTFPGVETASRATSRDTTATTYRDAATATCRATALAMTTHGAGWAASLGNDHAAGLIAPLHWSDVDII
jgi:hypothetical protein